MRGCAIFGSAGDAGFDAVVLFPLPSAEGQAVEPARVQHTAMEGVQLGSSLLPLLSMFI